MRCRTKRTMWVVGMLVLGVLVLGVLLTGGIELPAIVN